GINLTAASLDLINSTISENSAGAFLGEGGGGISAGAEPVRIINSTIAGNTTVAGQGGGVDVFSAPVTIENSIVADNTAGVVSSDVQRTQTETSLTINHSLIGNADGLGTINGNVGNLTGTEANPLDPQLGELADNGGPTLAHALLPGSPAIDAGDNALAVDADGNPLAFDQRGEGFFRFVGANPAAVDIGAFESQIFAGDLLVSTTADAVDGDFSDGQLSLREAVNTANARPGADVITFASDLSGVPIVLDGEELVLSDEVTIIGLGADHITIDANRDSRVFRVTNGTTAEIQSVTITGGNANRNPQTHFSAAIGGGILNEGGILTVRDSRVTANVSARGAGIFNDSRSGTSTVHIVSATIDDNDASAFGGGLYNLGDTTALAFVNNSTFSGNLASFVQNNSGGAIIGFGSGSEVVVTNSTIVGNEGGIRPQSGIFTINNSILVGNTRDVSTIDSALSGDSANNIIGTPDFAGNLGNGLNDNIVGDGNGGDLDPNAVVNLALSDNGGPTLTHALSPGSLAINAGSNELAVDADGNPLAFDQRGADFDRVFGGTVDMGAFELVERAAPTVESIVVNNGDAQRSMINVINVSFSEIVNVSAADFLLQNTDTGTNVTPTVSTQLIGGKTVATLTFSGTGTTAGSLDDGNYQLTVLDSITDAAGNSLDGDGDGDAGGNATDDFFRLFGDSNGDGTVNIIDFFQFRNAFGNSELDERFDVNGDGVINVLDFFQFRNRFGTSV
ncbi:MAG: choice-of-anchor Q domain-containing protein, partial [Planctomycetota bacterium]